MSIYSKLFPWQKRIVDKFFDKQSWGLFLDMGLGKTPISLAFAEQHYCDKVLVITINSKALEKQEDSGSWQYWSQQSDRNWTIQTKNTDEFSETNSDIFIVNYESLFKRGKSKTSKIKLHNKITNFITSCKGHNVSVIVDESHKIKNLQSQQTLAIQKLVNQLKFISKSTYLYLLTGTPFTQGYVDLYSQLKLLGCKMTKQLFKDNFCVMGNIPGLLGWQQPIVGYKNIDELFNLIHQYAITIKSTDVIDLPEQIFVNHTLKKSLDFDMYTFENVKKDVLDKYAKNKNIKLNNQQIKSDIKVSNPFFRNINYPEQKWLAETSGTFWLRARQLSIGFQGNADESKWFDSRRLEQLKDFLSINEDNYVIFYNFTPELFELYSICEKLEYNIDVYCGEIKSLTFYEQYCKQNHATRLTNKKNVILVNFASGSTGMNWQEYNKCIIFSIPLYKDYAQAIKRIHRVGQKQTTFYHIFYQKNWLDESMLKALNEAKQYDKDMFDADRERIEKGILDNK